MLRPLITLLLVIFLFGGTFSYLRFVNSIVPQPNDFRVQLSSAKFSVQIKRTFQAVPGSFLRTASDLDIDPSLIDDYSIRMLFKGKSLYDSQELIPADVPVEVSEISEIELGENEFFISTQHVPPAPHELFAIQVLVYQGNRMICETTFTGYPGSPKTFGTVVFTAEENHSF